MSIARQRRPSASRTHLLGTDLQQSVLNDLHATGLNRNAFTPYGFHSGSAASRSRMGFNGQLREPTGWYHLGNGHRVYNPVLMRFHSPDPLSPFGAGGINPYAYCSGSPVGRVDPSGKFWLPTFGNIISFLLSLIFTGAAVNRAAATIVSGVVPPRYSRVGNVMSMVGGVTGLGSRAAAAIPALGLLTASNALALGSTVATLVGQFFTGIGAVMQNVPIAKKWMADATANGQSKRWILWEAFKEASGWNLLRGQTPGVVPGRPPDIPLPVVTNSNVIRQGPDSPRPS